MVSKAIVLVLFVLTHSLFAWAALAFLKVNDEDARRGKKLVSLIGGATLLLHLVFIIYLTAQSELRLILAAVMFASSSILFLWAIRAHRGHDLNFAFTKVLSKNLVTSGPYSLMRHPLYTSYIIAWLAGVLATTIWLIIPTMVMFVIYYTAAKQEENRLLGSDFGNEYRTYVSKTKMFIPFVF